MKRIFTAIAFLTALSLPVYAQDFQKGFAAYNASDYATTLQEWTPLAEAGDVAAQNNLGLMHGNGDGVPQDYKEAVKWYRLAAEQGFDMSQHSLGIAYKSGEGVPQDYKEAVKWFRLAAEQGNARAQNNLATMYGLGDGVLQDNTMAHMWYNIASANGGNASGKWRDIVAKKMTPAAVEKAQAMAGECMSSGYKKCGY